MTNAVMTVGSAVVERMCGLFDRRFVVSSFLPALLFCAGTLALAQVYGLVDLREVWSYLEDGSAFPAAVAVLLGFGAVWVLAITLVAFNTFIIRRLEGYIPGRNWGPVQWLERQKLEELDEMISEEETSGGSGETESTLRLRIQRATWFPAREDELLPTAFGNAVRAFESYPGEMYGFEATRGWARLLAILPKEYRQVVDDAKSDVDFLVNLWFLSWVFAMEALVPSLLTGRTVMLWIPAAALASAWLASRRARHAAVGWGEAVKSGFDVYLPELRRRLGLPRPASREEEWEMWNSFSQAFLTADPKRLPPVGPEGNRARRKGHLRPV
jgi:hypothetical protein